MSNGHGHNDHGDREKHAKEESEKAQNLSISEINKRLPYWQRIYWWRPWVLLALIIFNVFIWKAPVEYHFLLIIIVIFIWAGFSWLSVIAYATMIIPSFLSPTYNWITTYGFLILLGLLSIMQIIGNIRGIGKELSIGIGTEMEESHPTPPSGQTLQKMVKGTAKAMGSTMGRGKYQGGNPFAKLVKGVEETIEGFFEFFGGGSGHH